MSVSISITHNLPQLRAALEEHGRQARFAMIGAINDTAFAARKELQQEMMRVFDRPTPYTLKSVYVQRATKQNPTAVIEPAYYGGKGVDPQNFIRPEVFGGARKLKRSEVALQRIGILPKGMYTVMPREPLAQHMDAHGNYKGSFIVQLLSYFKAFGEQGYRANMTDKRSAKIENRGRTKEGYKTINGVAYFVAHGRMRSRSQGGYSALAPGIWAKSGTHGSNVRPVLLFVKSPTYRPRLDMDKVGKQAVATHFMPAFERRLAQALATARP